MKVLKFKGVFSTSVTYIKIADKDSDERYGLNEGSLEVKSFMAASLYDAFDVSRATMIVSPKAIYTSLINDRTIVNTFPKPDIPMDG